MPEIKVSLEFNTQGKWEKFGRVELRMISGGKLLASAPLLVSRATTGSVSASFSVEPSFLNECELLVYVDDIPKGGSAYRIKLGDFVDLEKVSQKRSTK